MTNSGRGEPSRKITLERSYHATVKELWDLWTTKEGIEAWWGPGGFSVKVRKLDLRPGGEMSYTMTAIGADQIKFMQGAGMPLTTEARLTYTEIVKGRRLAYRHLADFIPGVEPYEVENVVEWHPSGKSVRMVLTLDAMHDEEWTQRSVRGEESQLEKLAQITQCADSASRQQQSRRRAK
ncbi:MAG: SRPBCC domain-containing protein [SAR324 cluster bacterium]